MRVRRFSGLAKTAFFVLRVFFALVVGLAFAWEVVFAVFLGLFFRRERAAVRANLAADFLHTLLDGK